MVDRRSVLMGAGALVGATALGGGAQAAVTPAAQLNATFESIFKELVANSPMTATGLGLDKGELAPLKAKLDPATPEERARGQAFLEKSIASIKKVDRSKLEGMDRINYDTVLWDYSNTLSGYKAFDFGAPGYPAPYAITQLTGSYQSLPDFLDSQHSIETKADADAYMSRLSGYATLLDQETARFKADVAKGIVAPDFALQKAITQLKGQRDTKAADSTLVTSITRRTKEKAIAGDWQTAATMAYETEVVAALDRQIAALEATLPTATHDAGVWHIPNGEAYYVFGARSGTSTDMTPDEIHKIGMDKVKEINAEIDRIMRPLGMTQGTTGERLKAMAKDPKFIYPNTDAGKQKLLDDLNAQIKVVEAKIPDYFGVYAKSPVTVRRVPVATELGAPGGYYWPASLDGSRPGAYYINLRDTAEVPSWTLPTLTYHEAVPGHHMQISIQQENKNLPMLRQISGFNAYIEGWALYSEEVAANDMGMYATDPYGRIGYLHDALFRACRLVVDTGMHSKRWTREQAMAFMDTNLGDPNETEIERYAVWPGQALGYMVGKIKWLELRAKMQAKQGAKFDIKTFHDTGLLAGAVPLAVLEQVYKDKGLI
ncbi:DUF885 family protein [Asticcacaulis sp. SL142]|uniref:DUF885 domain-containing protein n=1 Tax=Asticcacaulis sp. SL142 TaxID=2995155 RepID=UPI00226CD9B4|nr:DUF885 family protein [Asticcacaulis sp. SL142]WAC48432.1 DUF885 family protein [Asticcacaulis sp. SL142]